MPPLQGPADDGRPQLARKYVTTPQRRLRGKGLGAADITTAPQEDFRQDTRSHTYVAPRGSAGFRVKRTLPSRALAYKVTSGRSMTKGSR